MATSPLPRRRPRGGRNCYVTPAFSGVPKRGDKIRISYLTLPCRGPKGGQKGYVTPAFSGVPKRGDKVRRGYLTHALSEAHRRANCYVTPAFSRVPTLGDKITSGYITHAFSRPDIPKPIGLKGPNSRGPQKHWMCRPQRMSFGKICHEWCACVRKHPSTL